MENINLIFDLLLLAMATWMTSIVTGYGGFIGRAFNLIGWGVIVLGMAHLAETVMFRAFGVDTEMVEFLHRLIILIGFVLIIKGFRLFIKKE